MKKLCLPVNQVLEQTLSNRVFEIDVDPIEKFIHCFLQSGPFAARLARPSLLIFKYMLQNMSYPARSSHRRIFCLKVAHPATTHYNLLDIKPHCNGEFWFHSAAR